MIVDTAHGSKLKGERLVHIQDTLRGWFTSSSGQHTENPSENPSPEPFPRTIPQNLLENFKRHSHQGSFSFLGKSEGRDWKIQARFRRVTETPTSTTSQKSIAVHLQFVLQYASNLYGGVFDDPPPCSEEGEILSQYASHLYFKTPPICITLLLGKSWWLWSPGCSPEISKFSNEIEISKSQPPFGRANVENVSGPIFVGGGGEF